jgi:Mrr N-terminal domain
VIDRLVKQDIIGPSEAKMLVLSRNGIMPGPTYDGLFNPLLRAMRELGGSASVSDQEDKVAELLNLSEEEASEIHRGSRTKLSYRLAWERLSRAHAVVYFVGYDATAARRDARAV